jgi:uncharacterized membrane protein
VATVSDARPRPAYVKSLAPDGYEKLLSAAALVLLACVVAAILRGRAQWAAVPVLIWPHLLTIMVAVALTPVMLLRPRGTRAHRRLGWVWVVAMFSTALFSLFVRNVNHGGFSIIHILSVWTLIQVPIIVWSARTHNVKRHRYGVRAMVTGALLIAGFFTFPFDRLLGQWLFG